MQKFSGRGYHKIITIADETSNFFPITLDGVGFLIGTNDDLNVVDATTVKSNFIYDLENNKTYQVYSSDKDIWVYFSDDFGSVTLLDYTDKTTLPASFDDVIKLSDINLANFPDGSGGGGTVLASDVQTSDGSNAQVKFDDIEDKLDNLMTTDVSLLRGGTVNNLETIFQRYSLLTVFGQGAGSFVITDGTTVNLFDTGLTLTESPVIEGGGESYTGNTIVEWVNIYTETGVGTGVYNGSIFDGTNKVIKIADPEAQTGGFWRSYGLNISFRLNGTFSSGAFSSDFIEVEFTDNAAFSSTLRFLDPVFGSFNNSQQAFVSRINKDTSQLIQNGLTVNLTATGADFTLNNIELIISFYH